MSTLNISNVFLLMSIVFIALFTHCMSFFEVSLWGNMVLCWCWCCCCGVSVYMSTKMSIEIKTKWEVQKKQAMNEYPAECYVALLVRIGVPTLHMMPKKREWTSSRVRVISPAIFFSYVYMSVMERGFTTALHTSIDGHDEKNGFKKIPAK